MAGQKHSKNKGKNKKGIYCLSGASGKSKKGLKVKVCCDCVLPQQATFPVVEKGSNLTLSNFRKWLDKYLKIK